MGRMSLRAKVLRDLRPIKILGTFSGASMPACQSAMFYYEAYQSAPNGYSLGTKLIHAGIKFFVRIHAGPVSRPNTGKYLGGIFLHIFAILGEFIAV